MTDHGFAVIENGRSVVTKDDVKFLLVGWTFELRVASDTSARTIRRALIIDTKSNRVQEIHSEIRFIDNISGFAKVAIGENGSDQRYVIVIQPLSVPFAPPPAL